MRNVVNDTLAEGRRLSGRAGSWAVLLAAGAAIGLAGPFGTFETLTLPIRIAYWIGCVTVTFWLGYLISFAVASAVEAAGHGPLASAGLSALAASLPVSAALALGHGILFDTALWRETLRLLPYVFAVSLALTIAAEVLDAQDVSAPPRATVQNTPAWLDQLPAAIGRDLSLLQAQDHYLRAVTPRGEALVRATLDTATLELGGYGMRIHRSWWVAHAAVEAYRYRGGAPVVVLRDGTELPVGRTYRRAVRTALRHGAPS